VLLCSSRSIAIVTLASYFLVGSFRVWRRTGGGWVGVASAKSGEVKKGEVGD
jgi:hypothetical protein